MPSASQGVTVEPNAQTVVVTIAESGGGTPVVYADRHAQSTISMPATISTRTTFFLADPTTFTVSAKVGGLENANGAGGTQTVDLTGGGIASVGVGVPTETPTLAGGTYPLIAQAVQAQAYGMAASLAALSPSPQPTDVRALALWWRADSISGADGAAVTSWADKIGGLAVAQGTGSQQPVLKLAANGINGLPVVRFTGASNQLLSTTTLTGVPTTGPLTVVTVVRPTTVTTAGIVVALESNSPAYGWGQAVNLTNPRFTVYGVADYDATNFAMAAGTAYAIFQTFDSGNALSESLNNQSPAQTFTTGNIQTGATNISLGGRGTRNNTGLNGDIAEVMVFAQALSTNERRVIARYLSARYQIALGTDYNAAAALTMPSPDSTGVVTEPSVLDFGNGLLATGATSFGGYRYWMANVGLAANNDALENPSVYVSNDGNTWVSPPGLTNPVEAKPATGNNADPCLRYWNGTFYLYFIRQATGAAATNGAFVRTSTDGINWATAVQVMSVPSGDTTGTTCLEPKVVYDPGLNLYVMFVVNLYDNSYAVQRATCATPNGVFGALRRVNLVVPGGRASWHMDVQMVGGAYMMLHTDNDSPVRNMWACTSPGGINWRVSSRPVLVAPSKLAGQWDTGGMYRGCFQLDSTGRNFDVWYSAKDNSTYHHIGRTSIPVGEFLS